MIEGAAVAVATLCVAFLTASILNRIRYGLAVREGWWLLLFAIAALVASVWWALK